MSKENIDEEIKQIKELLKEAKENGIANVQITILKHQLKKLEKLKKEEVKNGN